MSDDKHPAVASWCLPGFAPLARHPASTPQFFFSLLVPTPEMVIITPPPPPPSQLSIRAADQAVSTFVGVGIMSTQWAVRSSSTRAKPSTDRVHPFRPPLRQPLLNVFTSGACCAPRSGAPAVAATSADVRATGEVDFRFLTAMRDKPTACTRVPCKAPPPQPCPGDLSLRHPVAGPDERGDAAVVQTE